MENSYSVAASFLKLCIRLWTSTQTLTSLTCDPLLTSTMDLGEGVFCFFFPCGLFARMDVFLCLKPLNDIRCNLLFPSKLFHYTESSPI